MKLKDLIEDIPGQPAPEDAGLEIRGIAYSSKAVRPGYLFAALKGQKSDGLDFVAEAERNGAVAVISEWPRPGTIRLAWVQVEDARLALALASAKFFGRPSDRLKVIGVTGTKGKTTVCYMLEEIFKAAGSVPGVIGTIEYRTPLRRVQAPHTTPEAPDLQGWLVEMLEDGVTHCVMEVSSHALEQKRVWGVSFDVAIFTNLSGEHLDYHGTMESYFEAKKKLFFLNHKRIASVVNADDPWGQKLVSELPMRTVTYGLDPASIVRAEKYETSEAGIQARLTYPGGLLTVSSPLVGKHNLYNLLAATAGALVLNVPAAAITEGLGRLSGVPGRFESIANDLGLHIVVDYAHTDDALRSLLEAVRAFKPRRILLVFGAGGNRDLGKRERMGRQAARMADWTILTSDNPRSEDPLAIIAAIEKGFAAEGVNAYEKEPDRREAIRKALALARKGDYVLVAGKGHEDYQIFKDKTIPFSDAGVIREILEEMKDR